MGNRQSPLYWSFPIGTWFMTHVRVSVFLPALVLVICLKLGWVVGGALSAIVFFSVLAHEFGHVVAARLTGGFADEILIWPLGGLAFAQPGSRVSSQFITSAAGPLVNLVLCVLSAPVLFTSSHERFLADALNPVVLPHVEFTTHIGLDLLLLVFVANWLQLLVNLIPVYPLDGGRMLKSCLPMFGWDGHVAGVVYIRIGFIIAFIIMVGGLLVDDYGKWIVLVGAVLLLLNMQESIQLQTADSFEDSFMGYDFSQGYTSLERSEESAPERRPGPLKRWMEARRQRKDVKRQTREKEADVTLDSILEKLHTEGAESLTEAEQRELRRASDRYRNKKGP